MIYIRVLGQGAIPRGMGIAPHKDPYRVDYKTLQLILGHGTLLPECLDPYTKKFIPITNQNLKEIYTKFDNVEIGATPPKKVIQVKPSTPVNRNVMQTEKPKEEPKKEKKETLKPVGNPDNK